jgi:hypothetical protein
MISHLWVMRRVMNGAANEQNQNAEETIISTALR